MPRSRITIAILALGGQGGGVLADWILATASTNGYVAQGTSVPGVAQRTGTTVYYIEMLPRRDGADPVLALNPVPGDVDIVVASELMEAGRAVLRGFVSGGTTLITSTHRVYAISEKSAMGNGIAASQRILAAAERRSGRFIGFDMDRAAAGAGSVISSVMLGALAASGALPFTREQFEAAIRGGGKAVPANLAGFAAGLAQALGEVPEAAAAAPLPAPTTAAGRAVLARIEALPSAARPFAVEGVRRLMDYQGATYAALYLDRLENVAALDHAGDRLTREAARYLALWMSYEDIIRVADLKIRASRFERVRSEVGTRPDQVQSITEYMHPRLQEVCEILPAGIGRAILGRPRLQRLLAPLFGKGRHVETSSVRWFVLLAAMAGLRRFRPASLRYHEEQARIDAWLAAVHAAALVNLDLATAIVEAQRLIKGYSDTAARGLANFEAVMAAVPRLGHDGDASARLHGLVEAALADEHGVALNRALAALDSGVVPSVARR